MKVHYPFRQVNSAPEFGSEHFEICNVHPIFVGNGFVFIYRLDNDDAEQSAEQCVGQKKSVVFGFKQTVRIKRKLRGQFSDEQSLADNQRNNFFHAVMDVKSRHNSF